MGRGAHIAAFLLLVLGMFPPFAMAQEKVPAWMLDYLNVNTGDVKVTVAQAGVLIETKRINTFVVSTPPNWDVITYNPVDKLIYRGTLASYRRRHPPIDFAKAGGVVRRGTLNGMTVFKLSIKRNERYHDTLGDMEGKKPELRMTAAYDFTYADGLKLPPEAEKVVSYFFNSTEHSGLFLERSVVFTDGQRSPLIAMKTMKKGQVPVALFQTPAGYKTVDDPRRVLGGTIRSIEDAFRDLRVGDGFGKR